MNNFHDVCLQSPERIPIPSHVLLQGGSSHPESIRHPATTASCAECEVTTRWLGYHRIWQGSGQVFDTVDLFLPDVQFTTQVPICLQSMSMYCNEHV